MNLCYLLHSMFYVKLDRQTVLLALSKIIHSHESIESTNFISALPLIGQ